MEFFFWSCGWGEWVPPPPSKKIYRIWWELSAEWKIPILNWSTTSLESLSITTFWIISRLLHCTYQFDQLFLINTREHAAARLSCLVITFLSEIILVLIIHNPSKLPCLPCPEYHWFPSFITVHKIHESNVFPNIQTLNPARSNCGTTRHFELVRPFECF